MEVIIEFEGFDLKNKFIFKEFCILFLKDNHWLNFFVKSDRPFKKLSRQDKQTVKFCQNFIHKIFWRAGHVDQRFLIPGIKLMLEEHCIVYTKGRNKKQILEDYLGNSVRVVNVEDLEIFGSQAKKKIETDICSLRFHKGNHHCAVHKALFLSEQLNHSLEYKLFPNSSKPPV